MSRQLLSRYPTVCLLALASACVLVLPARAGTITLPGSIVFPANSSGQVGPFGSNPAPNNDGSTAPSANRINVQVFANSSGLMDVEFQVADSGGITEYLVGEAFFNLTSQAWAGFHFELGYGIGAGFVASSADDGLHFDIESPAPPAGSPRFTQVSQGLDTLDFSGGLVSGPAPLPMGFTIDVPDRLDVWNPTGQNRFTLRQMPVLAAVPEPATAALLLAGVLGLIGLLRQRRPE